MKAKIVLGLAMALAVAAPAAAFAEGAVKVECNGACNLVNLGQVCDSFSLNSIPVAIACDDTAVGSGSSVTCGNGRTCRPFGSMIRADLVSAYCEDGGGFDAVVTCRLPTLAAGAAADAAAVPKVDDGAGGQEPKR
jgi:hypothetical protein